jgi:hypothetical protein
MALFQMIQGWSTTYFMSFLVLQESLIDNNIVFRCGKNSFNVLKFFSYKYSLFILVTQGNDD